jgi:hypothetical protein
MLFSRRGALEPVTYEQAAPALSSVQGSMCPSVDMLAENVRLDPEGLSVCR